MIDAKLTEETTHIAKNFLSSLLAATAGATLANSQDREKAAVYGAGLLTAYMMTQRRIMMLLEKAYGDGVKPAAPSARLGDEEIKMTERLMLSDVIAGNIAVRLQERNRFVDITTMRLIVDTAIKDAFKPPQPPLHQT